MAVGTRQQFKDYCFRNLGAPVLEINVDDDQVEDRIDEALEQYRLHHHDGIEQMYLKHRMRASEAVLATGDSNTFDLSGTITGGTSGATAEVTNDHRQHGADTTLLLIKNVEGTFQAGETITGSNGATATLTSVTLREADLRYIELPDTVFGVTKVLSIGQASSSKNIFDLQYQLRLNDLYDLTATSLIYYKNVMNHLALLDFELNGHTLHRFNRRQGRVYLDVNWKTDIILGDYVLLQGYRALDPDEFGGVWDDYWLKAYATALIKRQWGTNLKKFGGIALPGGVQLDGQSMYDEANGEIRDLNEELIVKSAPLEFFLG
jgi:hypothetical protein